MTRTFAAAALGFVTVALWACSDDVTSPRPTVDPSAQQQAAPSQVPGQYIVLFHDSVPDSRGLANQVAARHGFQARRIFSRRFKGFSANLSEGALQALRNNPRVRMVEPNYIAYLVTPAVAAPSVPVAGLRARLSSDALTGLSNGDLVDVWPNPEGSEGDAVAPGTSQRPTYHAGVGGGPFGGRAYVAFNEGGDNDDYVEIPGVTQHGSATVIAVLRQEDVSNHNYGFFAFHEDSRDRGGLVTYRKGGAHRLTYWDRTNSWNDSDFTISPGTDHVVVWRIEGSVAVDYQVDGVAQGSDALGADIHTPFVRYVLGNTHPGSSSRYDGLVAEVVVYDRVLPDCERDGIVEDLGTYYGISVTGGGACEPLDGAPTGLTATESGTNQIDLTWANGSTNEDGVTIERADGPGGPFTEIDQVGPGIQAYSDLGVSPDTEQCYRVRAFKGAETSLYSNEDCATTQPVAPPPPAPPVPTAGLRVRLWAGSLASSVGDGAGVDTWTNPEGSEGDAVAASADRRPTFYLGQPGGPFGGRAHIGLNEGGDNDEHLEISNVAQHTSGTVIAVVRQEGTEGHHYGLLGLYANGTDRAAFLTRHNAGAGPLSYWDQTNSWKDGSFTMEDGVDHVVVWRVDGSNLADFQVDGVAMGSQALSRDIHTPFDRYYLGNTVAGSGSRYDGLVAEVVVYDRVLSDCERDGIVEDLGTYYGINVTGGGACEPLDGAPSGLAATESGTNQIDLTWANGSTNEDGVTIERADGPGGPFTEIDQVGPGIQAYSDLGVSPDTEQCYRVRAFKGAEMSVYSNEDCATTQPVAPPPPAPPVPTAGLRVRLWAGSLAASVGDGAGVDTWTNPEGSEGDAVAASADRRPTFYLGQPGGPFGGRAHIGLNEGGDNDEHLEISNVAQHTSGTVIAVVRQEGTEGHNYGLLGLYANGTDRAAFLTRHNAGAGPLSYWDQTNSWKDGSFTMEDGVDHVVVWRVDGSNLADFQVDGVAMGSQGMSQDIHTPFDRYYLGNTVAGSGSRYDGLVAEVVVYDRVLSDCERDGIVEDLGTYYGINVTGGGACEPLDGAPSGLAATESGTNQIDLTWANGSTNEDGVTIERADGPGGPFTEIDQVGPGIQVYSDLGVSPDTEQCYRVRAFKGAETSVYSNEDCATTQPVAPPPPAPPVPTAGLRVRLWAGSLASSVGDGADVDTWTNPEGSEGDAVAASADRRPTFYLGQPGGPFGGQPYVGFNEGGDDDEHLEISSVTEHGSATVVAVMRQEDAASHNYGLVGFHSSSTHRVGFMTRHNGGASRLSYWDRTNGWNDSDFTMDAQTDHVVVFRVEGSVAADFQVDGVDQGSDPIGSNIHTPFVRYYVANSRAGSGAHFDGYIADLLVYDRALADCERDLLVEDLGDHYGIGITTSGVCSGGPPDGDPTDVSASALSSTGITVGWTDASSNEQGFTVERAPAATGPFVEIAQVAADVVVYEDVALSPETEYCYRVRGFNLVGTSQYSNVDCATTLEPEPPPPAPAVPPNGLRVRLRATDLASTLADGVGVDTWPNFEGSDGDAIAPSSTRQPTFHAGTPGGPFGGAAYVGFNEGSDNDEQVTIANVAQHGSATVVAVLRQESASDHNYGLLGLYASSADRAGFVTRHSGGSSPMAYWDPTNGWKDAAFTMDNDVDHVVVWRVRGSVSADFQVDGDPQGSAALFNEIHTPFDRYVLGNTQPSSGSRYDGGVAELLVYDRSLADCEVEDIVASMGSFYGISVNAQPTVCQPPSDPSSLSAQELDYETIRVSWTDGSSNENGFEIERRLGSEQVFQHVATTNANIQSFDDGGLVPEFEYCYRVRAFNNDGVSAYTNVDCTTTNPAPAGVCAATPTHDDLSGLWNIRKIQADENQHWKATQRPGCDIVGWYFGLDSGVDSDHPDLNVAEIMNFVVAEPGNTGEDANGHGTHTAGTAAAIDGNGGVVGVAPGAPVYGFRVCSDDGSCTYDDIIAGVEEVILRKMAFPNQPMVINLSLAGDPSEIMDEAVREAINTGIVVAIGAGNGALGACLFPANAGTLSPARVGDDAINGANGSDGDTQRINGAMTATSSNASDSDDDCNFGNAVTIAAPGVGILSTGLNGGQSTLSGTSMATPHVAGAALLYLQSFPNATPAQVEAAIMSQLDPWNTNDLPNADGRLNVREF